MQKAIVFIIIGMSACYLVGYLLKMLRPSKKKGGCCGCGKES